MANVSYNTATLTGKILYAGQVVNNGSTTIASGSNNVALPQATINVASTTGTVFPTSGTILVTTSLGIQSVTYTGKTSTTFTGCSGGSGTMATNNAVTSVGDIVLAPSNSCVKIQSFSLCNVHTSAPVTIDIYVVKAGATPGVTNQIISQYLLPLSDSISLESIFEGMMLNDGDTIYIRSNVTAKLNAVITGVEGV